MTSIDNDICSSASPRVEESSFSSNSSQERVTQSLPPQSMSQPHAPSKRKRTRPEDQSILEAEYQRNPKPDKVGRSNIVRRVALGEKEVQIWFQNRRQTTRRKSRPLLPHEIYPNLLSNQGPWASCTFSNQELKSAGGLTAGLDTKPSSSTTQCAQSGPQANIEESISNDSPSSREILESTSRPSWSQTALQNNTNDFISSHVICSDKPEVPASITPKATEAKSIHHPSHSLELKASADAVATGFDDEQSKKPCDTTQDAGVRISRDDNAKARRLQRTSSTARLSLSLDGKAQLVMDSGSSPSPPRKPVPAFEPLRRRCSLQRSKSATSPSMQPAHNHVEFAVLPRPTTHGRSRDARTWEFYCDSDARNALTVQAEQEQKGSAAGAISLIRAESASSKVVAQFLHQRNSQQRKPNTAKAHASPKVRSHKPQLTRAISSLGRLQTADGNAAESKVTVDDTSAKGNSRTLVYQDPSGDSDKENWEPGTQSISNRRQQMNQSRSSVRNRRSILTENDHFPSHTTRHESLMNQNVRLSHRREIMSPRGGKQKVAPIEGKVAQATEELPLPREEEDLDCVQNLLSLSQSAWR